jgi:sec-independent protein translocase protein TatA
MMPVFGYFNLGAPEILVLLVLGVLLFGRKLPEVGRYLGKGISSAMAPRQEPSMGPPRPPQRVATSAPKFEDNAGAMQQPPTS